MADSSASLAGAAGGTDSVASAHARLLQDLGLQFEFEAVPPPPELPDWLAALFRFLVGLQPVFEVVFWVAIAALVAVIAYFAGREVLRHHRRRGVKEGVSDPAASEWCPAPSRARALLSDADRLAGEGRYAEAVHLLLFRSIEDIDAWRPHAVLPAFTSRDILGVGALPSAARSALARLVTTVERSFFGARSVDATEFAACRRAYEEFALPDIWAERAL